MHQENALIYENRRKGKRVECKETLVINPEGVCELLDISSGGFSFKCLFNQSLSEEWVVDILDTRGGFVDEVQVEKVWQVEEDKPRVNGVCVLAVGVKFKNLSVSQHLALNDLILSNEIH